jgi:hypothetical protein
MTLLGITKFAKKNWKFFVRLFGYLIVHPAHARYYFNLEPTPWIVFKAIDWLNANALPTWDVFEWGSGASTMYFYDRCKSIVSIEHDPLYLIRSIDDAFIFENDLQKYPKIIEMSMRKKYDLIFIDGMERMKCLDEALRYVKPGGYIMVDDSDRPEYFEKLDTLSIYWKRTDFRGPARSIYYFRQTSVFQKPIETI